MRKILWGALAVLVCSTVGIFAAGRYAAMHPDSSLGRWAQAVYQVAWRSNPLAAVKSAPASQDPIAAPGKPVPGACFPIPAPEIRVDEHQEPPLAEPGERVEVVETIVVDAGDDRPEQAPLPQPQAIRTKPPVNDFPTERALPEDSQEFDRLPELMPYADDTDEQDGAPRDCDCMNRFLSWLLGDSETKDCPACGSSLVSCVVDFVKDLFGEESNADQGVQAPAEPQPAEEAQERRSDSNPASPSFREDPNYHQQYPGCPYSGQCPYPHHFQVPKVSPPRPQKPAVKPGPNTEGNPGVSGLSPPGSRLLRQSTVDTMECRPADLAGADYDRPF